MIEGWKCAVTFPMSMRVYSNWISDAGLKIYVYAIVWRGKTNVRALLMTARWKERWTNTSLAFSRYTASDRGVAHLCPLGPSAESIATPRRTTFVPLGQVELDPVGSHTKSFLDGSTTPSMGKNRV
jgi:hypothetical protein